MITLKEWMELVGYRITEGSEYYHDAYDNAYNFSHWNGNHDGHSLNIVFQLGTQTVYEVEVCDYYNSRAYRLINPDYVGRGQDTEAWDDVRWTDLEVDDDFMQKALAILQGTPYDTRVSVPVDLDNETFTELARQAHEQDITLNQLVENILRAEIEAQELYRE
jgi:hypothetical protein